MPKLNTTTSGIITATLTADSSPTLDLQQNGVTIRTLGESQLVQSTAQSTATGATLYDFTGIPSWAKRITVMFNGVSTSGTSTYQLQIGSGGVTTSGYAAVGVSFVVSSMGTTNYSTGFPVMVPASATATVSGSIVLKTLGSNVWVADGFLGSTDTTRGQACAGSITLSGTLDRVRITTVNGTDTFDAGTVNIMWE